MNTNNIQHHSLIALKRSKFYEDTLVVRTLKIIGCVMMLGYVMIVGFCIDEFFLKFVPNKPLSQTLLSFAICCCLVDFFVKLCFKKSSVDNVLPYITLPIGQHRVFALTLRKNLFSLLNFVGVVFLLPLFVKMFVCGRISLLGAVGYLLFTFVVSLFNSSLVRFAKSFIGKQAVVCVLCIGVLYVLFVRLACGCNFVFNAISVFMHNIFWLYVAVLLIGCLSYYLAQLQCKREFYKISEAKCLQQILVVKTSNKRVVAKIEPTTLLALRLVLRNKTMLVSLIAQQIMCFLCILLFSFNRSSLELFLPMFCVFAMGSLVMSINPFTYYMSYSFDGLQTCTKELMYKMAKSYHRIFVVNAIILALGYAFLTKEYMLFTTCGLLTFLLECIYLQGVVYATKRVDIFKTFTQANASNVKVIFGSRLVGAVVSILFVCLYCLVDKIVVCAFFSIVSMLFLLTSRLWQRRIFFSFMQNRYENMAGFRGEK